ncbi:hypothetical protein [Sorangium cellulosum]|uniref:hypothetical protein n=1 Tax=Sorangium cellulosum TaxID=56 RepID=UPI0013316994|nr:hypothetical protein [Sorangium cellulosum]
MVGGKTALPGELSLIAGRAVPAAVGVLLFPIPPTVAARAWLTLATEANCALAGLVTPALVAVGTGVAAVAAIHVGLVAILDSIETPVHGAYPVRPAHARDAVVLVVACLRYPARIAVPAAVGVSFPDVAVEHAVLALERDAVAVSGAVERSVRAVCVVQAFNLFSIAVAESRTRRRRRRGHIPVKRPCGFADVVRARITIVPHIIRVALDDTSAVMTQDALTIASVLAPRYLEQFKLAGAIDAGHLTATRVHVIRQRAVRCGSALRRRFVGRRRRAVRASDP